MEDSDSQIPRIFSMDIWRWWIKKAIPQSSNTVQVAVQQIHHMPTPLILGLGVESAVRPSSEPILAMVARSKRARLKICKEPRSKSSGGTKMKKESG